MRETVARTWWGPVPFLLLVACSAGSSGSAGMDASPAHDGPADAPATKDTGTEAAPVGCVTPADAGMHSFPPGIDAKSATELRTVMFAAASQSFRCSVRLATTGGRFAKGKNLPFKLVVKPTDVGGPEADSGRDYTVFFKTSSTIHDPDPDGGNANPSQSLVVSYISFVTPSLKKSALGKGSFAYDYAFMGAVTDELHVVVDDSCRATQIRYEVLSPSGQVADEYDCVAAP